MDQLKERYNILLGSYKRGLESMAEHNDDKNKEAEIMKKLEPIEKEMNEILQKIGIERYTPNDTINGFDLTKNTDAIITTVVEVEAKEEATVSEVEIPKAYMPSKQEISITDRGMTIRQDYQFDALSDDNISKAKLIAKSTIIPQEYQNKPENVIVALGMANKLSLDPFTVMQNLNLIKGNVSWAGSFCKFLIERTGKYKNLKPRYVGEKGKDTYGCYTEAIDIETSEIIEGPTVTIAMAKAEGWYGKPGSKWVNMPDLMLVYRCYSFFARVYVPEALNGVKTSEEIEDIGSIPEKRTIPDVL